MRSNQPQCRPNRQYVGSSITHKWRLHALLLELEAGGIGVKVSVTNASRLLDAVTVGDEATRYRVMIAREVVDDIARSAANTRHRLNLRGNRVLNHAIHIAAVTQLRHDTPGRIYYRKRIGEGKTPKEAIRALKRQISDAVYQSLIADGAATTN